MYNFKLYLSYSGHALSALGRKEEGLLVWEQGYQKAAFQSADFKQFLELEELLSSGRNIKSHCSHHVVDPIPSASDLVPHVESSSASTLPNSNFFESTSSTSDFAPLDSASITLSKDSALGSGESKEMAAVDWKPGSLSEICNVLNDSAKFSKKVFISGLQRSKSISLDFRLSRGISQVQSLIFPFSR